MFFQDSPVFYAIYYQHSEVPAGMFQPRQTRLGAPSPRPRGSARSGASSTIPYLGGKSMGKNPRTAATKCGQSSVFPGDPGRGRRPRVSHTCNTAPTPPLPAACPAWRSAAARPRHAECGGREAPEAPEALVLRDQILTCFLPSLGIKEIRCSQFFASK